MSGEGRAVMSAKGTWSWQYPRPGLPAARDDGASPPPNAAAEPYDELFDAAGKPRPHWARVAELLESLGAHEVRHRWDHARQLLHEHGVSYDAGGGSNGAARPWNLSPIPVVLGADAWAKIERGLAQRARLLDQVLADLYGPRRLIARGELPAEIAYAHPGFLRPCAGIVPPTGRHLPLYAADLVRGPDGRFMVLADRTQAPSGMGYALENRIVLSRSLPEVFRDCNVVRLATFFRKLAGTLRDLAPHNRDSPRIVLLTPGPYSATYFEQAFLAQYLDLTLARGDDLVVRDHRVYLKALGGLRPVDVLLRRVNDDYCDPLELRPDSSLGVPGLVEAVRAGNVAVANPLGSGLLQAAAIMPYLPALCRALLGEELALSSVPTYWCGVAESLAYVEAHLAELVVKPAFPVGPTFPVFASELTRAELDALRARIRARPRAYVAQSCVLLSTVPTLATDELRPAPLWMRAYLVSSGDGYEAMPGALSRVGRPGESLALSLRPGGESKDTWVLGGGPVSTFSLLPSPSAPVELSRSGGDLPSRVADNLFWLGRYAERTEATARLARAAAVRLSDQNGPSDSVLAVEALLHALEAQTHVRRSGLAADGYARPAGSWSTPDGEHQALAAAERFLVAVVYDDAPLGTLSTTAAETHRVARTIRDWISADTWRTVAELNQELSHPRVTSARASSATLAALVTLLDRVVMIMAALGGLAADSMTHGHAWRFLDMGRRLERAVFLLGLLQSTLDRAPEGALLEELLQIADGSMTYRRRYFATLQVAPVVDLLMTDETNPRSVVFQVAAIARHVDALPRDVGKPRTTEQSLVLSALAELRLADVTELCARGPQARAERESGLKLGGPQARAERESGLKLGGPQARAERESGWERSDRTPERAPLTDLPERISALLRALSDALSGTYFNHAALARQMR